MIKDYGNPSIVRSSKVDLRKHTCMYYIKWWWIKTIIGVFPQRAYIVHRYQMAPLLLYLIRTKKTDGLMAEIYMINMLYNLIQLKSITDTISSSILRLIFLSNNLLKYESKCGVSLLHKSRMQYEELWSFSQVSLPFHICWSRDFHHWFMCERIR